VSWLQKLLPPKIKRTPGAAKKAVPEGLWIKCDVCEAVLYRADLEKSLDVCPKCGHHNRVTARERLDMMLDAEGRYEIGSEVIPVDFLKFVDSRRYTDRLDADSTESGESDALVVMQGAIKTLPVVMAAFEFRFMGGSMGSVVGERFVRGVQSAIDQQMPFICFAASGASRQAFKCGESTSPIMRSMSSGLFVTGAWFWSASVTPASPAQLDASISPSRHHAHVCSAGVSRCASRQT